MAAIEVEKEMLDKIYEIIEVAKATGKVKKGTNETTKAIEKGNAKFVAVASDIDPKEIAMHIPIIAEEKSVPCYQVPSKEDLGAAAGIQVSTGSVAVVQEGEAKNLINELLSKTKK